MNFSYQDRRARLLVRALNRMTQALLVSLVFSLPAFAQEAVNSSEARDAQPALRTLKNDESQPTLMLSATAAAIRQNVERSLPSSLRNATTNAPMTVTQREVERTVAVQTTTTTQTPAAPSEQDKAVRINPLTTLAYTSSDNYRPLTGSERWELYLKRTYLTPGAYFGVLGPALADQFGHQPPEWGQGLKGYSRRAASRMATRVLQNSIQASTAALMGLEPRYVRSSSKGFWRRTGHALKLSILTYNNEGRLRLNAPLLLGDYGSAMLTTLWLPDRYTALGDGVRDGNRQMIFGAAFNLIQEFIPEIKRLFRR